MLIDEEKEENKITIGDAINGLVDWKPVDSHS